MDDLDLEGIDDSGTDQGGQQPPKWYRENLDRLTKKHEKELEKVRKDTETRVYDTFARRTLARQFAEKAGYPKLGERFMKDNPDAEVTEEAIIKFITDELGLPVQTQEPSPQQGQQDQQGGLPESTQVQQQAQAFQSVGAGTPAGGKIPRAEWESRLKNPATHEQALHEYAEGRVEPLG